MSSDGSGVSKSAIHEAKELYAIYLISKDKASFRREVVKLLAKTQGIDLEIDGVVDAHVPDISDDEGDDDEEEEEDGVRVYEGVLGDGANDFDEDDAGKHGPTALAKKTHGTIGSVLSKAVPSNWIPKKRIRGSNFIVTSPTSLMGDLKSVN